MIGLREIIAYVGAPPAPVCEVYRREVATLTAWAWRDAAFGSKDGWWCAVTCSGVVLGVGWTSGNKIDRDRELVRMLVEHRHVGVEVAA